MRNSPGQKSDRNLKLMAKGHTQNKAKDNTKYSSLGVLPLHYSAVYLLLGC